MRGAVERVRGEPAAAATSLNLRRGEDWCRDWCRGGGVAGFDRLRPSARGEAGRGEAGCGVVECGVAGFEIAGELAPRGDEHAERSEDLNLDAASMRPEMRRSRCPADFSAATVALALAEAAAVSARALEASRALRNGGGGLR